MIYFVSVAGIAALSCIVYCVIRTKNMSLISGATLLFIGFFAASIGVGTAAYPIAHSIAKESAVGGYHQQLNGNIVDISDRTGLAERIAPLRLGPRLEETVPIFWR